jgi:hypothetical protein
LIDDSFDPFVRYIQYMNWLNQMERKGKWLAIPNVTLYLIILQSLAWFLIQAHPELVGKLVLERSLILDGEWWRLLSFILLPPDTNVLFLFFAFYMFYLMGSALEAQWGTFRYNLYLFIAYLATIAAVFIAPEEVATNGYIGGSVFLAFAFLFPDFEILIFFILPVKVKWIALITWALYVYQFATGDWLQRALILASVLNFILFFGFEILDRMKTGRRRMVKKMESTAAQDEAINRCAMCGKTEKSDPKMEFRYCPLCVGTPCYCMPHMQEHTHRT